MTPDETKMQNVVSLLGLPRRVFMQRITEYINECEGGNPVKLDDPLKCPVHLYMLSNNLKCVQQMVANIAYCPFCGAALCPDCGNHHVEQLSRITGYMQAVSGWNSAKKEELRNRYRYDGNTLNGVKV